MSIEDTPKTAEAKAAKPARKPAKAAKPKVAPAGQPVSDAIAAEPVTAVALPTAPVVAEPPKDDEGRKDKKKKKAKKKEKKRKDAVIIRFDNDQLTAIDARAEALGLSRAAWVRMVVAKALS